MSIKDLDDVQAEVRDAMNFILVDRIDEAIEAALKTGKDGIDVVDSDPGHIRIRPEIEFSPVTVSSKF